MNDRPIDTPGGSLAEPGTTADAPTTTDTPATATAPPAVPAGAPTTPASEASPAAEAYLPLARSERRGIAFCLSGGGYRAALFHLGALCRLNEVGLLSRLTEISSVSGGSIISAHLATRVRPWPAPGEVFPGWEERVARPFRAFTRRNIRTKPVLERLAPWNWLRSETSVEALAAEYAKYLTPLTLPELPERPSFTYCATDLTYGVNWILCRDRIGDYQAGYARPDPPWPLARAVAASSCFPPVFDPLPVGLPANQFTGGKATGPNRDALVGDIRLTDGGVYDNMGLEPVWKNAQVVVVSDGGAVFDYESGDDPIRRIMRYITVIGDQAGRLRKRWLISSFLEHELEGTYWGIGSDVERYRLPAGDPAQQPRVGYSSDLIDRYIETIRTDMDAFSPAEICVLENHGYTLADAALRRHLSGLVGPDIGEPVIPHPEWMDERRVQAALRDSSKRKFLGRN